MRKLSSLIALFGSRCVYCKRRVHASYDGHPDLRASRDHDVPRCRIKMRAIPHFVANEVLACLRCNNAKGDMTGPEFVSFLQTRKLPESYIHFLEERLNRRVAPAPSPP